MQVKEVMSKEVITVKRSTTLRQLLGIFAKFHIFPLVPVIEKNRRLIGIVSFCNLIDTLEEAYKLMRLHLKEEFPVVDKAGKLVGMVGISDVIRPVFRQKGIIK